MTDHPTNQLDRDRTDTPLPFGAPVLAHPHSLSQAVQQPQARDRTMLVLVAAGVTVLAVVLVAWWIVESEARALEQELGLARHETTQQLGMLEDDVDALDGRLGELPGPLDRVPSTSPPVIVPVPTPAPAPQPAPVPEEQPRTPSSADEPVWEP